MGRGRIVEEIGRRMKSGDQEGEMMKEGEQVEAKKMKMEEGEVEEGERMVEGEEVGRRLREEESSEERRIEKAQWGGKSRKVASCARMSW